MPYPAGTITITLQQILNVDLRGWYATAFNVPHGVHGPLPLDANSRAYVVAVVNQRIMGRSTRIPDGVPANYVLAPGGIWTYKLRIQPGDAIHIEVQVWLDQRDTNVRLHRIQHDITVPVGAAAGAGGVAWNVGNVVQHLQAGLLDFDVTVDPMPGGNLDRVAPVMPADLIHRLSVIFAAERKVAIEITRVDGLYQPRLPVRSVIPSPPPALTAGGRLSQPVAGYKSLDDRGRIFLNRDLNGAWTANRQRIRLRAEVTARLVPLDGAELIWRVAYPDDPSDDLPRVFRLDGPILDAADYGPSIDGDPTPQHQGASSGGNDIYGAIPNPPWQAVPNYAMRSATAATVITSLVRIPLANHPAAQWASEVELDCPDSGGDRLIVEVGLETDIGLGFVCGDRTGIMSVWERVSVDYYWMDQRMGHGPAALHLPVSEVPRHFEPAFVQLDFEPEQTVPPTWTRRHMADSEQSLELQTANFITNVFLHNGQAGWFCLVAAKLPYPLPADPGVVQEAGVQVTIGRGQWWEYIEVPFNWRNVAAAAAGLVTLSWGNPVTSVQFDVISDELVPGRTITLMPLDITDGFTGHDSNGSLTHAYATMRYYSAQGSRPEAGAWTGGHPGFGAPSPITARIETPGARYTAGISPPVRPGGHGAEYFAGRTIVFTHHGSYADTSHGVVIPQPNVNAKLETVIVHELTHAFGMPHKCGKLEPTIRRTTSCAMNYDNHWITQDLNDHLWPRTDGRVGPELCARHVREVRRVHLEDNLGLRFLLWQ